MLENKVGKITRLDISNSLKIFGVMPGDLLYIRANLGKVGRLDGSVTDVILGGILDLLGPEGTLIVPAFTKQSKIWEKPPYVFDAKSVPYTGALSKLVLSLENVVRSKHPTHSFAAVGKYASFLLETHDEKAACFEPMRQLIKLNGKMMLIGCADESPGFSTVHLVQYDLGLSQKHYLKYFYKSKFLKNGREEIYLPKESPGCSQAFSNFYKDYDASQNFITGNIGDAWSLCVHAKKAYEVEMNTLKENPRYIICGDPTCISCYITRGYNKRNIPFAIYGHIKKIYNTIIKKIL
ncbi:MAG: AAC(3) family N-acetyltransferase [Emcibacter sp.]|nr:AAC(3) family N-acetyltransferase [Emcibacter sp.]